VIDAEVFRLVARGVVPLVERPCPADGGDSSPGALLIPAALRVGSLDCLRQLVVTVGEVERGVAGHLRTR
jgi:hypothetical protein